MNTLDVIILIVFLFCGLLGLSWGLIRQVLAVAGLLAGIGLAGQYGPDVAAWLSSFISNQQIADLAGFVLVVVAVSAFASLLASLFQRFLGLLWLGWLDRLAGGVLGLVQAGLVSVLLILTLAALPADLGSGMLSGSQFAPPLGRAFSFIVPALPTQLQDVAVELEDLP